MSVRTTLASIITIVLFTIPIITFAGTTINGNDFARFDNPTLGIPGSDELKVNFNPTNGTKANLTTSGLTGNAWAAGTGWIKFQGSVGNTQHRVGVSCGPSTQIGTLNGYGWGEGSGWINFDTTQQDVTVDSNGYLDGAAWAQSTGWMVFESSACPGGDGCVQFDFQCPGNTSGGGSTGGSVTASCSLYASDTTISSGESVDLSWSLFGTNSITLNTATYGPNDIVSVSPKQTTLYTASVTRNNITRTCSTTITVDGQNPTSTDTPTCKDPEANNYDPSGDVHKQSVCTYTFDICFQDIDADCDATEDILTPSVSGTVFDPATQCDYFKGYWKKGSEGGEVAKIQDFLNRYLKTNLVVDGEYGKTTAQAVGQFQKQHREDILDPWNYILPTNRWYKSTRATANGILGCAEETVYLEDVAIDYIFDNPTLFGTFKNFIVNIFN